MALSVNISIKDFLVLLPGYLTLSWILFTLTTGGWESFAWMYWSPFVWSLIFLICFIIGKILEKGFKLPNIKIFKPLLYITLIAQLFALLFNTGDNADAGGSYTFIDRILNTAAFQNSGVSAFTNFSGPLLITYLALFLLTIIISFSGANSMPVSNNRSSNKKGFFLYKSKLFSENPLLLLILVIAIGIAMYLILYWKETLDILF